MTTIEAIRSYPALDDVKSNLIDKVLTDRELDGTASYSSLVKEKTELVAADLMLLVANNPKFREGDLSIEYSPAQLKGFAKAIYDEYNDPKAAKVFMQPTVSNGSNQW